MHIKQIRFWVLLILAVGLLFLAGCKAKDAISEQPGQELFKYKLAAGTVTSSAANMAVADGESVTLTAKPFIGYSFAGWTKGAYLENYGELVSENAEYTFTKNSTDKYFANFIADGEVFVCYYGNGGTINDVAAKNDRLIKIVNLGKHLYPVSLSQKDTFSREGYVLTEYASQADGSGTITNIGQRVFSDAKIINLYAQWSPESDASTFTYAEQSDGVYITGYTGSDEVLTIPAKLNGKTVVGIKANAVSSDKIKKLVLPETIKTLDDDAFQNCSSLKTVYLYDTVTDMTDETFSGCPIETVCLNSVYDLKYYAEGAGKLELLYAQKDAAQNRLVVLSGSSGIYGLDAKLLQSSLKKDFKVVNFGLQIAVPGSFSMRMMKEYLHSGDVVLYAPECEFKQFDNALTTNTFIKYDGVYTAMRNVDLREYTSVFSTLSLYSMAKSSGTEPLVVESKQFFDENGDYAHTEVTAPFAPTYNFNSPTQRQEMTNEVYARLNDAIGLLKAKGVKTYLSFAPFCSEACSQEVTAEMLDTYSKALADNLDVICISSQSAQNYSARYFFEMFHMTAEGKQLRTEKLSQELNAQFDKEN